MQVDSEELFPLDTQLAKKTAAKLPPKAQGELAEAAERYHACRQELSSLAQQLQGLEAEAGSAQHRIEDEIANEASTQHEAAATEQAGATARYEQQQQGIREKYQQETSRLRSQAEAEQLRIKRANQQKSNNSIQLDAQREAALAEARERHRRFSERIGKLSKQLDQVRVGLPPLEAGSEQRSNLSFSSQVSIEGRMNDIALKCDSLKGELKKLTSIWQRFIASTFLSGIFQMIIAALALAGGYALWQFLPNKNVAIGLAALAWLLFALLLFFERGRRLRQRRRLLATYTADTELIAKAIGKVKAEGEAAYNPETVVKMAVDDLLSQQERIDEENEKASLALGKLLEEHQTKVKAQLRQLKQQQENELAQLETTHRQEMQGITEKIGAIDGNIQAMREQNISESRTHYEQNRTQIIQNARSKLASLRSYCQELYHTIRQETLALQDKIPWQASADFPKRIALATVELDEKRLCEESGIGSLAEPAEQAIQLPVDLSIPQLPLLLIQASETASLPCLHQAMTRLLADAPPRASSLFLV